jgi:hypothetical protein
LDGGYIIGGIILNYETGIGDALVAKFDSSSNLSWIKTIGGDSVDRTNSIKQTLDGGYIMGGITRSYGTVNSTLDGYDWLITKLDSSGNLSWAKIIGEDGTNDFNEGEGTIQQTSDGGYVMVGYTESYGGSDRDAFVVKLDSYGNHSWSRTFGGSTEQEAFLSIHQTSDGGYMASGVTSSYGAGGKDIFIAKLDSSGNPSWMKAFGGSLDEVAESATITSDGGYIMTGYTKSYADSSGNIFVLKLDSSGNPSWMKAFGETDNLDSGYSIKQTSDGGYIVAGDTRSYGVEGKDAFLLKLNPSGNLSWAKIIGGIGNERVTSIQQTPDGGYVMSGNTNSYGAGDLDFFLLKLDPSGDCPGCSLIQDQTSNVSVSSPTPTVTEVIPEISSPSPTVTSVTPIVTNVIPEENTLCSATSTFNPIVIDSTGRIAIGTSIPTKQLDVRGDVRADRFCFKNNCYSAMSESPWTKYGNNIIFNNGNIGVGTSLPKNKLNIIGDINITGDYINNQSTGITGNYTNGNCWIYYSGGIVTGTNCSVQS